MNLIFLGAPGAGKGTQAHRLSEHFQIAHIATGDMLRRAVERQTDVGRRVGEIMAKGELVPDDLTNELVEEATSLPEARKGFVLDGYPRNVAQATALDKMLDERGGRVSKAVRFMVKGPEIAARLAGRRVCPVCKTVYHLQSRPPKAPGACDLEGAQLVQRPDDQEETVLHRLEVYGKKTRPLFDFYSAKGLLADIDAMGTEEEVFGRLLKTVN